MDELAARLRTQTGPDAAIAFGALALATATVLAFARMEGSWAAFPLLLLVAIPCAALFGLALLPERGAGEEERSGLRVARWRPVALAAATVLLAASLLQLVVVLGDDPPGDGILTLVFLLTALVALTMAMRYDSPGLLIVGLLWLVATSFGLVEWVDSDAGTTAFRNVTLAVGVLFLLLARALRPTRLGHSNVAVAVAALLLVIGAAVGALQGIEFGNILLGLGTEGDVGEEDGWELVLVVVSLGALAYTAWQRYRGAAYPGVLGIVAFIGITAGSGDLAGWPLILLLVALACLAWGFSGGGDRRQGLAVRGSGAPSSETSGGV